MIAESCCASYLYSSAALIISAYLLRLFIQGPFYKKTNRIDGKVVIVTGCNTGIGKQTALELAKRGGIVYMACRDSAKCEEARQEVIEKSKNEQVYNKVLDLNSLQSVRDFAESFLKEQSTLDILINNAGIMAAPKTYTTDGFESHIGVNHFGHFLLTNLLLDALKKSESGRIVVVSSLAYIAGGISKSDINSDKSYNKVLAYAQSKLANILFAKQLTVQLKDTNIVVNSCHPGVVKTELIRHIVGIGIIQKAFTELFTSYFFKSVEAGAQTSLKLAIDPELSTSGNFYLDTFRVPLLPKANDMGMAEWLWNKSEQMTGLKED